MEHNRLMMSVVQRGFERMYSSLEQSFISNSGSTVRCHAPGDCECFSGQASWTARVPCWCSLKFMVEGRTCSFKRNSEQFIGE